MTYATSGWTALGDPTRRTIFERLVERPSSVGELAAALPVSRPAVSQHLKVLKDAGLVTDRREGRWVYYTLDPAAFAELEGVVAELAPARQSAKLRTTRGAGSTASRCCP